MGQAESQGCCSKSEQPSVERIEAQSPAALSLDEIRLSSDCESGQRAEHGNTDTSNSDAAATIPPAPEKMQQTMTAREVPLLEALSATETPMKQYLLDGCVDGKRAVRLLSGLPVIACLILSVAAVSSMPFVILGSRVVPLCPFSFWLPLLQPKSRKKGTLIIKGLLGNLGSH